MAVLAATMAGDYTFFVCCFFCFLFTVFFLLVGEYLSYTKERQADAIPTLPLLMAGTYHTDY